MVQVASFSRGTDLRQISAHRVCASGWPLMPLGMVVEWPVCGSLVCWLNVGAFLRISAVKHCAYRGLYCDWGWWWSGLLFQLYKWELVPPGSSGTTGGGDQKVWLQETCLLTNCWGWDGLWFFLKRVLMSSVTPLCFIRDLWWTRWKDFLNFL